MLFGITAILGAWCETVLSSLACVPNICIWLRFKGVVGPSVKATGRAMPTGHVCPKQSHLCLSD